MFRVIVRTDKFDWDNIDYLLMDIDSPIIPTVGSTFIHRYVSGELKEDFEFKISDVKYVYSADYFNVDRLPKNEDYYVNVYVEPTSSNATYKRISYLLDR